MVAIVPFTLAGRLASMLRTQPALQPLAMSGFAIEAAVKVAATSFRRAVRLYPMDSASPPERRPFLLGLEFPSMSKFYSPFFLAHNDAP